MWRRIQRLITGLWDSGQLEREIADRKRIERALTASRAEYQALIESLPLNIFRKDLDGRIVSANQRFCDSVGLPLTSLLGKTDLDLFPPERRGTSIAVTIATSSKPVRSWRMSRRIMAPTIRNGTYTS